MNMKKVKLNMEEVCKSKLLTSTKSSGLIGSFFFYENGVFICTYVYCSKYFVNSQKKDLL